MGPIPLAGAVGIILGGVVWYRLYGREKTDREGAALDAMRRRADQRLLRQTETALEGTEGFQVLVPVTETTEATIEATLLRVAASLVHQRGGRVQVVQFEAIPEQTPLSPLLGESTPTERTFERSTRELAADPDLPVEVTEVATHDVNRAIVNFATHEATDLILSSWDASTGQTRIFGSDVDWLMDHAPCDVAFLEDRGLADIEEIAVVADVGPYDPLKIALADAIAAESGARLRFVNALGSDVTEAQFNSARSYHAALDAICTVPTKSEILRTDSPAIALAATVDTADLVVMGAASRRHLTEVLFGSLQDSIVTDVETTVLLVHSAKPRRHTFLRGVLERAVYRT